MKTKRLRLGNFQFFNEPPKIISFEEKTSMLDELTGNDLTEERRSEILVTLKQDVGYMHTALDSNGERITKLEGLNADLKATNQSLYNQLPPTYVNPNLANQKKEETAKTEREEKLSSISINDMMANS